MIRVKAEDERTGKEESGWGIEEQTGERGQKEKEEEERKVRRG